MKKISSFTQLLSSQPPYDYTPLHLLKHRELHNISKAGYNREFVCFYAMTEIMSKYQSLIFFIASLLPFSNSFQPCSFQQKPLFQIQTMRASNDDNLPGSFFNQVPNDDEKGEDKTNDVVRKGEDSDDPFDKSFAEMMKKRKGKPLASNPSTINGIPTKGKTITICSVSLSMNSNDSSSS